MTVEESLKAINAGVDLHGVCLYPFVDVPDWWSQKWAQIGIYDVADKKLLERVPVDPYIAELRHWQKTLDQPDLLGNLEWGVKPPGNAIYRRGPIIITVCTSG